LALLNVLYLAMDDLVLAIEAGATEDFVEEFEMSLDNDGP